MSDGFFRMVETAKPASGETKLSEPIGPGTLSQEATPLRSFEKMTEARFSIVSARVAPLTTLLVAMKKRTSCRPGDFGHAAGEGRP